MKSVNFFVLSLIMFILFANGLIYSVNALTIDYYGVDARIRGDRSVETTMTIDVIDGGGTLEIPVKYNIYDFSFEGENVSCTLRKGEISFIVCDLDKINKTTLKLYFKTKENVKSLDGSYEFSFVYPMNYDVNRFFGLVYLPETAVVATENINESIYPHYGRTLTDGKHIMVYWEKEGFRKGDNIYVSVIYKMPSQTEGYVLSIFIAVAIAIIILFALGVFYFQTTRQRSVSVVMPLLREDERVVVEIIKNHGGSVNQKVIVRESDFSKAKVSRIISELRERGIIEVQPMGRTNKIILKARI